MWEKDVEATSSYEQRRTNSPKRDQDNGRSAEALRDRNVALSPANVVHLQRAAGNASVSSYLDEEERSPVHDVIEGGGGQPLETSTRHDMESTMGHDFSGVRIHTDDRAAQSAASINAQAYTVGDNIVFGSGHYEPQSDGGKRMLAHELTHVVQQRSGPVSGNPVGGGLNVSEPGDPFERQAEQAADHVMSGHAADSASTAQRQSDQPVAQRQEEEEEEEEPTAQGTFAQRQEPEEEEEPEEETA